MLFDTPLPLYAWFDRLFKSPVAYPPQPSDVNVRGIVFLDMRGRPPLALKFDLAHLTQHPNFDSSNQTLGRAIQTMKYRVAIAIAVALAAVISDTLHAKAAGNIDLSEGTAKSVASRMQFGCVAQACSSGCKSWVSQLGLSDMPPPALRRVRHTYACRIWQVQCTCEGFHSMPSPVLFEDFLLHAGGVWRIPRHAVTP
jgi:hypothetical protein